MFKSAALAVSLLLAASLAMAQDSGCAAKAIDKNGKALAGAAKNSFMKKCEADAKAAAPASCESLAISKSGKPLAGAAKASFVKKCEADAKAGK